MGKIRKRTKNSQLTAFFFVYLFCGLLLTNGSVVPMFISKAGGQ